MTRPSSPSMRLIAPAILAAISSPCSIAAPTGGNIVSGTGSISNAGAITDITQTSQNIAIDWTSFNINNGETVNFIQPDANSIALNRDFSGSASQLFGDLNANGHVFLLNTAGVLIGSGASINVGSLLVSDMSISNSDAQNFGAGSNAGTLAFSDADLQAGGITHLGSITTTGANGATFVGQYIHVGGDLRTTNGDITFKIGGSAVLVTDPAGMYGVELNSPISQDISGNGELFGYIDTPAVIESTNGDIHTHVQYRSELEVTAVAPLPASGNVMVQTIAGQIFPPIIEVVTPPPTISPPEVTEVDNTITESLSEEPQENTASVGGDNATASRGSLDNIIDDCVPQNPSDKDCIKQNAIKRYLGKLLIGGSLPD